MLAMVLDRPPPPAPPSRPRRRLRLVTWRPRVREDCANVPRPCPFVGCRYHLWLDVVGRQVHVTRGHPDDPLLLSSRESCALDVAEDQGALDQYEVGRLLGFVPTTPTSSRRRGRSNAVEQVRRIQVRARDRLLEEAPDVLRALLDAYGDVEPDDEDAAPGTIAEAVEYFGERAELAEEQAPTMTVEAWVAEVLAAIADGATVLEGWAIANGKETEMAKTKTKRARTAKGSKGAGKAANGPRAPDATEHEVHKPVEGKPFTEKLPVEADVSEQAAAGAELAKLVDAREALKIERRDTMAELKERMASIDVRMNELSGIYKGKKLVPVKCVERLFVEENRVEIVRLDTGEVVRQRTATAQDRQLDLEGGFGPTGKLKGPDEVGARMKDGKLASDVPEDEEDPVLEGFA